MKTIMDKLYDRVEERGVVCVGLDTSIDYVPDFIKSGRSDEDAIVEFNRQIIEQTHDIAACFKVQIAYYESLGLAGMSAYKRTLDILREKDAIIVADIKRGDIAATAKMYAKAHFEGDFEADFITLSPYMGMDSIEPYMPYLETGKKGIFSLVRTSNKGAEDIEYLDTTSGDKVYHVVGDRIMEMGKNLVSDCGYHPLGGVIGCTHVEEGKEIRERYKNYLDKLLEEYGYGSQEAGKGPKK